LKGTADIYLKHNKSENTHVVGYSDVNYAGDLDNRHSISGSLFLLSNGAISWFSKKQPVVTLSTTDAEYVVLSAAVQVAVLLTKENC